MTIGDIVRVYEPGKRFGDYVRWVERNAPDYVGLFINQTDFDTNSAAYAVGEVVAIAPHGGDIRAANRYGTLALILTEIKGVECAMLFTQSALSVIGHAAEPITEETLFMILTA